MGWGAHHEVEWRGLRAAGVVGLAGALPARSPYPFADLVFSGTLYVDMVPEEVAVLWGSFKSVVGECPADAAREARQLDPSGRLSGDLFAPSSLGEIFTAAAPLPAHKRTNLIEAQ